MRLGCFCDPRSSGEFLVESERRVSFHSSDSVLLIAANLLCFRSIRNVLFFFSFSFTPSYISVKKTRFCFDFKGCEIVLFFLSLFLCVHVLTTLTFVAWCVHKQKKKSPNYPLEMFSAENSRICVELLGTVCISRQVIHPPTCNFNFKEMKIKNEGRSLVNISARRKWTAPHYRNTKKRKGRKKWKIGK
jgi:hypothetical protein